MLSPYHWEFTIGFVIIVLALYLLTIFNKKVYFKAKDEIIPEKSRLNLLGLNLVIFILMTVGLKMLFSEYINSLVSFVSLSLGSLYTAYWIVEIYVRLTNPKYKKEK